jgi:hypothetical protein
MAVKLVVFVALAAFLIIGSEGFGLVSDECKEAIKPIMDRANKTFENLKKNECGKLCATKPVKASALWPHEEFIFKVVDCFLVYLKTSKPPLTPLDVDTICSKTFQKSEIRPTYQKVKAACIKPAGKNKFWEVDNHPNLCKAGKDDFPKTVECVKGEAIAMMADKMSTMPLGCAQEALKKYCNKQWLGAFEVFFFDTLRKDYKIFPGCNPWKFKELFFTGGCTGKSIQV